PDLILRRVTTPHHLQKRLSHLVQRVGVVWITSPGRTIGGQERAIFERAPALFVNCGSFVTGEEQLNPRIYAFINEDAHSTIWRFAKSSTARTCSRLMLG